MKKMRKKWKPRRVSFPPQFHFASAGARSSVHKSDPIWLTGRRDKTSEEDPPILGKWRCSGLDAFSPTRSLSHSQFLCNSLHPPSKKWGVNLWKKIEIQILFLLMRSRQRLSADKSHPVITNIFPPFRGLELIPN